MAYNIKFLDVSGITASLTLDKTRSVLSCLVPYSSLLRISYMEGKSFALN